MECKYCGTQVDETQSVCPACGGSCIEPETENMTDISFDETLTHMESTEEPIEINVPKKREKWQVAVAIGSCVLLVVALALVILKFVGVFDKEQPIEDTAQVDDGTQNSGNEATDSGDIVVAKMNDLELTNGVLQVFYTQQVYEYMQYYSSVLSHLGLDTTKPLSEQICMLDESMSWQDYFVDIAIETWQRYAVLNLMAARDGIEMPDYLDEALESIRLEMNTLANQYGYADVNAFLQSTYGANVDIDDYMTYMSIFYYSEYYYSYKGVQVMPLTADIEAYFEEHQEDFAASNVTKDSGPIVSVRHLLVQPDEQTDEAWDAAYQEAQRLLEEWKSGDADEDSFAALATEYTEDGGSKSNGGLYQNITRTSNYVEPFLNWAVDESRKTGDTGIVKTDYGYHIMYFVSGEPQWFMLAKTQLLSERMNELIDAAILQWPMELDREQIAIYENEIVK